MKKLSVQTNDLVVLGVIILFYFPSTPNKTKSPRYNIKRWTSDKSNLKTSTNTPLSPPSTQNCHLSKVWRPTSWKNPGESQGFQGQIVGTPKKKKKTKSPKKHTSKKKHLGFCCWFFARYLHVVTLAFLWVWFQWTSCCFPEFQLLPKKKKTWRHPFFRESLQRISCHRSRHKAPLQCQNPGQPPEELKQFVSVRKFKDTTLRPRHGKGNHGVFEIKIGILNMGISFF